jgi:hypothetical protein
MYPIIVVGRIYVPVGLCNITKLPGAEAAGPN